MSPSSRPSTMHSNSQRNKGSKLPQMTQQPPPSNSQMKPDTSATSQYTYEANLKALRRRDPSIISILDQFSHVCIYHHNGEKWEKQGYEGSMFIYERESYPPYGFFILNRVGPKDYVQRLYPEDDLGAHGNYLMLRSYPDFTARRLAQAQAQGKGRSPEPTQKKFSPVFAISNPEKLLDSEKGRSVTVGLWMFATDAREPMIDVMMRLHSYIKRNVPYPEEFRYGPDRPPPPNPHLQPRTQSAAGRSSSPQRVSQLRDSDSSNSSNPMYTNGNSLSYNTELDKLFAKLGPTNSMPVSSTPMSVVAAQSTASSLGSLPTSTSKMTVESLFAVLGGQDVTFTSPPEANPPSSTPSTSGIALLNTIFASASTPDVSRVGHATPRADSRSNSLESKPESITVHSPASSATRPHVQVLTEDVIFSLLGSRPSSRSVPQKEGEYDNDDRSVSDDGYSESSTVLDSDAQADDAGASAGIPLEYDRNGRITVNGDVTPRPFAQRTMVDNLFNGLESHIDHNHAETRSVIPSADVPLWSSPPHDEDAEDMVELDFADTSALSDPDVFEEVLMQRKRQSHEYLGASLGTNGHVNGKEKRNEKGKKKEKKERAATGFTPAPAPVHSPSPVAAIWQTLGQHPMPLSPPASPSPEPSPVLSPVPVTTNGTASQDKGKGKAINGTRPTNGKATSHLPHGALDPEVAKDSILNNVLAQTRIPAVAMERNEFVREVLTLIHTDKTFVDTLWQDYLRAVQ